MPQMVYSSYLQLSQVGSKSQLYVYGLLVWDGCVWKNVHLHPSARFCYPRTFCISWVWSPMAMWTSKYAHYGLYFYPSDANHKIGSSVKLLRDLEKPPVHSFHVLFDGSRRTPLYEALLHGKEVCMSSLSDPPQEPILAKSLLPTLYMQLDNCVNDNKCQYMLCYWTLLVAKGISKGEVVLFLIVDHTHDDIDASITRWSMKLHGGTFLPFHFLGNHT